MCEFLSLTDGRVDDCILRQLSLQLLASKSQTKPVTYSKSTCRQLHGMTLRQMNKASRVVVARPFGFLFLCMQPLNVHETNEFALLPQLVQPPEKSWGQERDFCGSTQSACPGAIIGLQTEKYAEKFMKRILQTRIIIGYPGQNPRRAASAVSQPKEHHSLCRGSNQRVQTLTLWKSVE